MIRLFHLVVLYKKRFNFLIFQIDFVSFSHQTNAQRLHADKQNEKQLIFLNKKHDEYVQEMNGKY
jgi:hypothetical protein